jgi:hypothetical protein
VSHQLVLRGQLGANHADPEHPVYLVRSVYKLSEEKCGVYAHGCVLAVDEPYSTGGAEILCRE